MSNSSCCFLTCIQISQEAGQVVWYSHLFQNFPQFIVIHIVKGVGIINKAWIDVFLELLLFRWSRGCWQFDLWFLCMSNQHIVHLQLTHYMSIISQCIWKPPAPTTKIYTRRRKKKIPKSHRDHLIPPPHVAQDRLPGSCSYPCEFEFMWGTEVQVEFSGWNICSPRFKAKTTTTTTKNLFFGTFTKSYIF